MNEIQNPYQETSVTTTHPHRTLVDVEISRGVAEVQAMVLMAKKFPRDPIKATERILNECQRVGLAEVALYSYSRGGTDITGPSIRMSEVLARHWGNLEAGVKELSQSDGKSEMMSYCTDYESNYRQVKVFTVSHTRHTKKGGSYLLTDSRDIYEATANQAARRLRAVILAVIPGDVIEAAVQQCESTLKAKADTSPEALKKMVEAFGQFGVTKQQIEKRIQRKLESITAAQVISLRKIYNSLKDAMSTASDWFQVEEVATPEGEDKPKGAEAAKQALRGRPKKVVEEAAKQETQPPEPGPSESGAPEIECRYTHETYPVDSEECASCSSKCDDYRNVMKG